MKKEATVKKLNGKNDQITIFVKPEIFKPYSKLLREDAAEQGYKIIKSQKKHSQKTLPFIVIELLEDYNNPKQAVKIGAFIEQLKYKAASQKHEDEYKQKDKEKNTLRLKFPHSIGREFKEQYGDKLGLDYIVSGHRGTSDFHFDVTDCVNRTQIVNRVLAIADAVNDITTNKRFARNKHEIDSTISYLKENCNYMEKTHEVIVPMTGEELIESGYATLWDLDSPTSKAVQKVWNWVFGKKDNKHFYMGKEVEPEQKYMVKLHKPKLLPTPEPINFSEEIWRRYVYGEQVYLGHGISMVHKFQNEIIDTHNENVKKQEESNENPDA